MNWTEVEKSLMRQVFPTKGARGCLAVMPNRSHWAIEQQAKQMQLSKPKAREADYLFAPNVQVKPLSDLDRIALREWGHITRTGQLRPIVKVELEAAA